MADKLLVDYIKQMTAKGADRETIKAALISAGWQAKEMEEGLSAAYAELAQPAQTQKPAAMPQPAVVSQQPQPTIIKTQPQSVSGSQTARSEPVQFQAKPFSPANTETASTQPIGGQSAAGSVRISVQPTQSAAARPAFSGVSINSNPALGSASAAFSPAILNNISSGVPAGQVKKINSKLRPIIFSSVAAVLGLAGGAAWYFWMGPGAAQVAQTPALTTAQVSNLGSDQIKNAAYLEGGQEVRLNNGSFAGTLGAGSVASSSASGTQPSSSTGAGALDQAITISFLKSALGDLNGDSNGDAAVILKRKDGNAEGFSQLAVLINQAGQPQFADAVKLDAEVVKSISIDGGTITLSSLTKASGTQSIYPDQEVTQKFTLAAGKLVAQNPVLGMKIFNHAHIADFEGRSYLIYQISYPGEDFSVKMESQNRVIISEKKTALNHVLTISYEGGRGFSPIDYWTQVLKKNCSGCALVSSTTGYSPAAASVGSAATSTTLTTTTIINIPGARNPLVAENKTNKWIIWESPTGTARLFIAQLQKPTGAIEKIFETFRFVDWADSGTATASSTTPLPVYIDSSKGMINSQPVKDISEILDSERAIIYGLGSKANQSSTISLVAENSVWKAAPESQK